MTEDAAKILCDFLLPQIEQEHATTRKVLAAVPAAKASYKPSEVCMSALELASHIAIAETFFLRGVINGAFEWKQLEFKTPEEVLAYYDETVTPLIAQVREMAPAKLAQTISFATWNDPAVMYLNVDLKHGIHHRGQLCAYLRPMGAKVPSVYGPSADDQAATA